MSQYWTELVKKLDPYIPGEQPQDQQYVKLNTNENPYPPSARVIQAIDDYNKDNLKRYPDPESTRLTEALAKYHDVEKENVFVGNGSDEVLAHSFQAFFKQKLPLLYPEISYSFYPVYCGLYEIDSMTIPLKDNFSLDCNDFNRENGGIILPNPNAPTGIELSLDEIENLCRNTSSVVIIDEAYIDFGGTSAIALTKNCDNLLVIQTFSKSRSLAGLRLGYAIGHSKLIEGLNRIKNSFNSYPVDAIAQVAAIAAVEDEAYFQQTCSKIMQTRKRSSEQLTQLGFRVLPSAANFIFVSHKLQKAEVLYQKLKTAGVLVRYFNKPHIDNYLRITIGTDEDMQTLMESLKTILN